MMSLVKETLFWTLAISIHSCEWALGSWREPPMPRLDLVPLGVKHPMNPILKWYQCRKTSGKLWVNICHAVHGQYNYLRDDRSPETFVSQNSPNVPSNKMLCPSPLPVHTSEQSWKLYPKPSLGFDEPPRTRFAIAIATAETNQPWVNYMQSPGYFHHSLAAMTVMDGSTETTKDRLAYANFRNEPSPGPASVILDYGRRHSSSRLKAL